MEFENFETIVDSEPVVDVFEGANDDGSDEADGGTAPWGDVAGCGGNTDESADGTFAGTDDGELAAVLEVCKKGPAEDTHRGCAVGIPDSDHSAHRGVEGGATVEAEPTKPDQCRAEKDDSNVVRLVDVLLMVSASLAKNQRISETRSARGDVHRPTTSEVQGTESVEPAVGIPGPVGYGAVADGDPEETEDDGREDATALERASDHDHGGAGGEHELVKTEDDVGNDCAAPGGCGHDLVFT